MAQSKILSVSDNNGYALVAVLDNGLAVEGRLKEALEDHFDVEVSLLSDLDDETRDIRVLIDDVEDTLFIDRVYLF